MKNILTNIERIFSTVLSSRPDQKDVHSDRLPQQVSDFQLIREMCLEKKGGAYRYGLYQNQAGEQAFLKAWMGTRETVAARWLSNEITTYRILRRFLDRHPELRERFPEVHVPRLIESHDSRQQKFLLTEFIEGERLEECSWEERREAYEKLCSFLEVLGEQVAMEEGGVLPRRGASFLIAILPIITLGALLRHPEKIGLIATGFLKIWSLVPALSATDRKCFAHRDPGGWNTLVRDGHVWIIDFQLAALTHPLFDLTALTLKLWARSEEGEAFLRLPGVQSRIASKEAGQAFRALAIHLALYNLYLSNGREVQNVCQFLAAQLNDRLFTSSRSAWCRRVSAQWWRLKSMVYLLENSSTEKVIITPFNPDGRRLADEYLAEIGRALPDHRAHLIGSVGLGIAGRRDIDIFIECFPDSFELAGERLQSLLGLPDSRKAQYWEWKKEKEGWEVDILLIDPQSEKFKYQTGVVWRMQRDPLLLSEYERLKYSLNGKSERDYEREKQKFFMKIEKVINR
jgi:tRNA A-37 threonylcarbamoyl transferase component Bud32